MNKLVEIFKQRDKQLHFVVGAGIALVAGLFLGPIFGFILAFGAAILKEWYDAMTDGTFDDVDMVVTAVGGLIVSFILGVINYV